MEPIARPQVGHTAAQAVIDAAILVLRCEDECAPVLDRASSLQQLRAALVALNDHDSRPTTDEYNSIRDVLDLAEARDLEGGALIQLDGQESALVSRCEDGSGAWVSGWVFMPARQAALL